MKNRKIEPWRLVVGIASILYIIAMYVRKDLVSIDVTLSLPLIVTSIAVTLLKVTAFVIVIFVMKWVFNKIKK